MLEIFFRSASPVCFFLCLWAGQAAMRHRLRRLASPAAFSGQEQLSPREFFARHFSPLRITAPRLWAEGIFLLLNALWLWLALGGWWFYRSGSALYQAYNSIADFSQYARQMLLPRLGIALWAEGLCLLLLVGELVVAHRGRRRLQRRLEQLDGLGLLADAEQDFLLGELRVFVTGHVQGDILVGQHGLYRPASQLLLSYSDIGYLELNEEHTRSQLWYRIQLRSITTKEFTFLYFIREANRDAAYNAILGNISALGDPRSILADSPPRQDEQPAR